MSNVIRARALLLLTYFAALPAFAQTIPALTDTSCAGQRAGQALTPCTANDFTSAPTFSNTAGISTCVHGQTFTADVQVSLVHSAGNKRYNIGFFTGQTGTTNPAATTSGNVCSAAAMPTSPAPPWSNLDNNACGDMNGANTANPTITGVKVSCDGLVGGNPQVPFLVVWDQNAGTATSCTGSVDVKATTGSKCNGGTAPIGNVTITAAANLAIVKNISISGTTVTYTLLITNNGPDGANGATYSDAVPNTVAISSATCGGVTGGAVCGTQPNVSGQNVTGNVGTLPNGGTATITITGTAANNAVVDNTASVSTPANTTDPNTGDNSSTAMGTVGAAVADVSVQKTVSFSGNTATYTLVITNFGPAIADGATYSDTVPAAITGITAGCGGATGGAACGTQPNVAGQNVTGTIGTLPNGGSVTITITGTGATGAVADNTANVQPPAGTNDTNNNNNSSTATGTVPGPTADVSVVKNVAINGNLVTYTLVISNAGPAAADGEAYTDNVPVTVTAINATCGSATGSAVCASPNVSGQTVSGSVPTLPSGGSVTITIAGTAANNAVVDNTGSISPPAGTTDPNSNNNSSTVSGTVGAPVADISVVKSVVINGNTVTYKLVIANSVSSLNSADLTSYTDTVPAAVAISSATCGVATGSAACGTQPTVGGQTVSGTVGTLPPGGSVTITITGTAANGAVVDNTASVQPPAGTNDPNNGNNSSTATGTVGSSADLAMAKSLVVSGNTVTYTLTITNNGPNAANGATYSDAVPATVTLTGTPTCATATGSPVCGTPNVAGNMVSGTVTTFPAGSSVTVTITGTATNGADVGNSATVTPPGGTTDPNLGDNTGTATGTGMPVKLQSFDVSFAPTGEKSHEKRLPN